MIEPIRYLPIHSFTGTAALLSTTARAYDRRSVISWALYDVANSSFTTLVVTFIYGTYFAKAMASNEVIGTALWSRAITITALVVAITSPFIGAIADRGGYRKRFLATATIVCILATGFLFFPQPGQIWTALSLFVIANVAFELANVFYNAYLPEVAPPDRIGRISGYGWAAGYVGGLLCLVIALLVLVYPDAPPFGLLKETGANIRATNLLVAGWFAVFSLPLFLYVKERRPESPPKARVLLRNAARELGETFSEVRRYRQVFRLLLARLIYNDGLVTVFSFGGIYAAGTFGFTFEQIMVFGIAINISAGLGAYAFGFIDDRLGGKSTIVISLIGLFAATLLALSTTSTTLFWVAGLSIGLLVGPNQSASRSLMGRFVPSDKENEFYGFYAFSGKATSFLGPLLLGIATQVSGSQRWGLATLLLFFVIGALLMLRVDEQEGSRVAQAASPIDLPSQ